MSAVGEWGAGAPRGVALRLQSAGPGDGQQGAVPPRDHVISNLNQKQTRRGLSTHERGERQTR